MPDTVTVPLAGPGCVTTDTVGLEKSPPPVTRVRALNDCTTVGLAVTVVEVEMPVL